MSTSDVVACKFMAISLVKTVAAVDPSSRRNTYVVLPYEFVQRHFEYQLACEFHQLSVDTLLLVMVSERARRQGERYKFQKTKGRSAQVSVPRDFLQNNMIGAARDLEIWAYSEKPDRLLFRMANGAEAPDSEAFRLLGE